MPQRLQSYAASLWPRLSNGSLTALQVIMEADGETLAGFNIVVGGGMGRAHKNEVSLARLKHTGPRPLTGGAVGALNTHGHRLNAA